MKKAALLLALTGTLGITSVTHAIPIVYDFTGTVTAAYSFFTPVPIGAPVSGSFTYDPTTISISYFYNYQYGSDIGIYTQVTDHGQTFFSVQEMMTQSESELITSSFTSYGGSTIFGFHYAGISTQGTTSFLLRIFLSSNSIPIFNLDVPSTLNLIGFSSGSFEYTAPTIHPYIRGDSFSGSIDTVSLRQSATMPEPATLALMSLGLAGIGFGKRCKHSNQHF